MTKEKSSFLMHHDTLSVVNELSDSQAGELIKEILNYSIYLNNPKEAKKPTGLSGLMNSVLYPFKMQLDRDLNTYLRTVEKNKINGRKGGRPRIVTTQPNPTEAKEADNGNGNGNGNGNDSDRGTTVKRATSLTNLSNEAKKDFYQFAIKHLKEKKVSEVELDKFIDYWKGEGGVKKDWKATFRNWCRKDWVSKTEESKGMNFSELSCDDIRKNYHE